MVLAGIRGEALAPGKKMEERGFTRPEVLRGRKEDKSETRGSRWANPHTPSRAHGWFLPTHFQNPTSRPKRNIPGPSGAAFRFCQVQAQPPLAPTYPTHYALVSSRRWSRASSWCRLLSPKAEPWYPRAVDSAFGAGAGASPVGSRKEPALGAGTLAGTTGAGKGGGSGAWELPAEGAEAGTRGPSEGLQEALPGLGLQKSRSGCSFCSEKKVSELRAGSAVAVGGFRVSSCRPTGTPLD